MKTQLPPELPDPDSDPQDAARRAALLDFALAQSSTVYYVAEASEEMPLRFISPNIERLTGHTPAAFLSEPRFGRRLIHPEDLAGYEAGLLRLRDSGSLTHEYRFATAAGDYRWFRDELKRAPLASGGEEILGCMVDVTAEKQAAELLRDAVESLHTGFALYDAEGRLTLANEALVAAEAGEGGMRALLGLEREEILLRVLPLFRTFDGMPVEPSEATAARLERRIAEQADASIEIELADGRWRLVSWHPTSQGGQVVISADITEQKRREAELRQAREMLEDAIESLSEGFVLWDGEDRMVTCNAQYKAFNPAVQDLLKPGALWADLARARAERGQFANAVGRIEEWLEERIAERGKVMSNQFPLTDGRWFEDSHRRTRQGGLVTTWREITGQLAMEQALREREEMVRQVLEGCPLPIALTRVEDGQILYRSPALVELFREPAEEKADSVVGYYADPETRRRYLDKLLSEGKVDGYEVEYRRRDGSRFIGALSGRLIEFGGETAIVASVVDLSDQKRREAELRQARETMDDAIESLSEGLALYDADDRLVLCNSQYKSFNVGSEDLLVPGAYWPEVTRVRAERGFFSAAAGRIEDWLAEQMALRDTAQSEVFPSVDGHWYEYSHRPTRQGGFVSTWRDVTERKAMEQVLRDSEEMLSRVLSVCPIPITMYRVADASVVYENPAAEALFGRRSASDAGPLSARWADAGDWERHIARLHESGVLDGVEVAFRRGDGTPFWGALFARWVDYQGSDVAVASVVDLTERREVEAEMARQRELLHQSEKLSALGELLAGVAHELNNPLSVLVGQATLLRETSRDEAVAKRAQKIGDAADRCARIVKTFLAMARQRPGQVRQVDVNEVVRSALEVTGYSLRTAGIKVSVELDPALPPVTADEDQIRQVVVNLVVNADHALQEIAGPRKLQVSSAHSAQEGQAVIRVEDNGPGVPEELRRRIFEPLFTTKEVGSGTGIGLALCHRIIEAHGGTLVLEGGSGEGGAGGGAAFAIRLPVSGTPETVVPCQAGLDPEAARYRVLVIDDEPEVADSIADILEGDGHEVEIALSGERAMMRIEESAFDLVLSDVRMPGMDGPHLFRTIGERRPALTARLAFITGDTMSGKVRDFLETAGCRYIEKPITPKELRNLVRAMSAG